MNQRAGGAEDIYKITHCCAVIGLVRWTNNPLHLLLGLSEHCGLSRMWEETGVSRDQQQSSLNYFRQHTQITDIMEACMCRRRGGGGGWKMDLESLV